MNDTIFHGTFSEKDFEETFPIDFSGYEFYPSFVNGVFGIKAPHDQIKRVGELLHRESAFQFDLQFWLMERMRN